MTEVPERWIAMAAQALCDEDVMAEHTMTHYRIDARIVLSPVLNSMVGQIEALKPYEDGRISKGLVLAILLGELGDSYRTVALTDLDDGPTEQVVFVEAPEDD